MHILFQVELEMIFPPNFEDVCLRQVNYFEKRIKEYAAVFYDNPILISRTKDTGSFVAAGCY